MAADTVGEKCKDGFAFCVLLLCFGSGASHHARSARRPPPVPLPTPTPPPSACPRCRTAHRLSTPLCFLCASGTCMAPQLLVAVGCLTAVIRLAAAAHCCLRHLTPPSALASWPAANI
ncbi:hypothetical protein GGX14DRAFT_574059 [Mycena pura]|uniref:Uncharacterized protein n=1 Tax=Mycena pura TaxID=153505 RepID=A0AAD6Y797_9AGAR|nr:hypothetical protein GGX14DRAFT_574059 [Mycena pura]